jgi:ubiquinone/menaquinone biosynthesis C-methylase UbiE
MMDVNNKYTLMQKKFYTAETPNMSKINHRHHDSNPDYWDILLKEPKHNPEKYKNKVALDFACGCGRNVDNMLKLADWKRVDGIDISPNNVQYCDNYLKSLGYEKDKFAFYTNNGIDVQPLIDNEYDFIMSTIALQHIPVHEIRYSLLKDLYRILKPGGTFSLQVGFDKKGPTVKGYYENFYNATSTNSGCDFAVEKVEYMIKDLEEIGYEVVNYMITNSFSDETNHAQWIYWELSK